jgi:cyclic di-GMP phosphodiesterase
MEDIVVAIVAKLGKPGAKDIDLIVSSYYIGHPSPCHVIEDGAEVDVFRGQVRSLKEVLDLEVGRRLGYVVQQQVSIAMGETPKSTGYRPNLDSQLQEMTSALERSFDVTVEVLINAMILKHPETIAHSKRVTAFSIAIARTIGLSSDMIRGTGRGALLHDIGKLAIPNEILLKKGPLNLEEMEIMRSHCGRGHGIVANIPFLKEAAEIICSHHENYDGSGYPHGLRGEEIPLGARIVALSNALDVITCDQPYRAARPFVAAMEEIQRSAGTQFDPEITRTFLKMPESIWSNLRKRA